MSRRNVGDDPDRTIAINSVSVTTFFLHPNFTPHFPAMPPLCTRCASTAASVQLSSGGVCLTCFCVFLQRTFRTSLGRLGAGGAPHRLALAISGGPSSSALALLHAQYISTLHHAPTNPPPPVLLLHALPVTASSHPAVSSLSSLLPCARLQLVRLDTGLQDRLAALADGTDRGVLARAAVVDALLSAAKAAGCDTLLFGTTAHRAAADVLLCVGTGRGAGARVAAATESGTRSGVRVVRPLRDVPARLVLRYARAEMGDVQFDARGAAGLMGVYKGGLGDVVEKFVEAAGEGNAASVHNVVKTGDRLREGEGEMWCEGCGGVVRRNILCHGCEEAVRRAGGRRVVTDVLSRREVGLEEMRQGIQEFLL